MCITYFISGHLMIHLFKRKKVKLFSQKICIDQTNWLNLTITKNNPHEKHQD